MVRVLLNLATAPRSDAADALALAVTHLQRAQLEAQTRPAAGAIKPGTRPLPTPLAALIRAAERRARTAKPGQRQ